MASRTERASSGGEEKKKTPTVKKAKPTTPAKAASESRRKPNDAEVTEPLQSLQEHAPVVVVEKQGMSPAEMKKVFKEGLREFMEEARGPIKESGVVVEKALALNEQQPAPELAIAAERVREAKTSLFDRYHKALGFMTALSIGALSGTGITSDRHEQPAIVHEQGAQERVTRAALKEIMTDLHSAVPSSQTGFEALLERKLGAALNKADVHPDQSGMHLYMAILQNYVADELRLAAEDHDFEFASRVNRVLSHNAAIPQMELCALAGRADIAVATLTELSRSSNNPIERHNSIAYALDDLSETTTSDGRSPYLGFTRQIVHRMQQMEGASAGGQRAMHTLGAELEAGMHTQERMALNWQRHEEENPISHLESVRHELERIHQAERILGTNPVVPLSTIDEQIRRAEQTEDRESNSNDHI